MIPGTLPLAAFDQTPRTRLVFGCGVVARLGELVRELGGTRVLLVTDGGIVAAGHVGRALEALGRDGLEVFVYDAVRENPTTADVAACLEVARTAAVDLIVGFGGGSSMDTAKGTNFILTNGGVMKDYWGVGRAKRPMLPLIAVPTTAGTGSECQSAALIADDVTHQKMACLDPKAAARIALLDPELTVSMPAGVTAFSGIDAIAHAVETAVTTRRNAVSMMHSMAAFQLLVPALPRVLANPADVDARGRMLLGAAFSGTAIELSMLGAAHSAANPLTAHFNIVHGAAVGLMLPHVIRCNAAGSDIARGAYAELARAAGLESGVAPGATAAEIVAARIEQLLDLAGIPRSLEAAGVAADGIPALAEEAARQWTAGFNPVPMDAPAFEKLYQAARTERKR